MPQKGYKIQRRKDGALTSDWVTLADEIQVDIHINGRSRALIMASPGQLDWLALGFMFGEGFIEPKEVTSLKVEGCLVKVRTTRPENEKAGKNRELLAARPIKRITLTAGQALSLMAEFEEQSWLFRLTGATHCCCLKVGDKSYFAEDIGRHNALDKAIGGYLDSGAAGAGEAKILLATGRVSAEFILRAAGIGCGAVLALGAPTDRAVELARNINLTLIGFARKEYFNIYSGHLENTP